MDTYLQRKIDGIIMKCQNTVTTLPEDPGIPQQQPTVHLCF